MKKKSGFSGQPEFVLAAAGSAMGVGMKPDWIAQEMERDGKRFRRKKLYSVMIRFVMLVIMLIIFLQSTGILNIL